MPIPNGTKSGGFWKKRSQLEKILICVLLTLILTAILLLVFVIKKSLYSKSPFDNDTCNTTTCINEAAKLLRQIDPSADPCEDFYRFACGNFLKNGHGDEKLNLVVQMRQQQRRELVEMYAEDIQNDEHKMVKVAKHLFNECMNEAEIEKDNLRTIKDVLKEVGGWPVLEGFKWDKENFNWLRTTYKLRELGYDFSVFLDVRIQRDIANTGRYIFRVETADHSKSILSKYSKTQGLDIMTEIAMIFGAERASAAKDMDGSYRFWKYLRSYALTGNKHRLSVSEFQQRYGDTFDWLEFINNITGPAVTVSKNDYILFQAEEDMRKWIELISTTPKRTLANYMMWTVIEKQLPYLTKNIRNLDIRKQELGMKDEPYDDTRAYFCLKETEKRFVPSPMQIMYNRKYLPVEKKKQVTEILLNIKSEFVDELKKADWMEKRDKRITVAKAEAITMLVGQPGNYLDNKILDDLDVDLVETKTDTFLSFLAQANRNQQTSLYKQINISTSENLFDRRYINDVVDFSIYDEEENVIFVPTIATQGFVFHENRPNYLNYRFVGNSFCDLLGSFGRDLDFGGTTTEKWSNETKQAARKKGECLVKEMADCELTEDLFEVTFAARQGIGEQISYAAYEKWVKTNGEEQKLIGIGYTPRQLFWIHATQCHINNIYSMFDVFFLKDLKLFKNIACGARRNNHNFAKDFDCPAGSRMNPFEKCEFL